ncbi:transcriptional regulator [Haloferacaceae archaeon DSL9]
MIVPELDETVHQATRLRLFAYLYTSGETTFTELTEQLGLTAGNLYSHLETMERAGSLHIRKSFVDRRPETTYRLCETGRRRFETHLRALEGVAAAVDDDRTAIG